MTYYEKPTEYTVERAVQETEEDIAETFGESWHERDRNKVRGVLMLGTWQGFNYPYWEGLKIAAQVAEHWGPPAGVIRRAAERLLRVQRWLDYNKGLEHAVLGWDEGEADRGPQTSPTKAGAPIGTSS